MSVIAVASLFLCLEDWLSDNQKMPVHAPAVSKIRVLDPLVINPGRLSILLALTSSPAGVEFVDLRQRTRLTDGNLASHARRLADAGLIGIEKEFRAGKPVTTYLLTSSGKASLRSHVDGLVSAVVGRVESTEWIATEPTVSVADRDDDWVD